MPKNKAIPGIPFGSTVGDSLDLVRKMWGMTGLPGIPSPSNLAQMAIRLPQNLPNMVAPTLDVNELEKRITDLKAVEQWLELNVGMLRTTIQSLEVQRATIATLKGLSGALLPAAFKGQPEEAAAIAALQQQFAAMQAMQATQAAAVPTPPAAPAETLAPAAAQRKARRSASSPPSIPAPLNPGLWWGAMQDQFARIAATAAAAAAEASAEEDAKALAKAKAATAEPAKKPTAKARPRSQ